jgi:hypothetical protein
MIAPNRLDGKPLGLGVSAEVVHKPCRNISTMARLLLQAVALPQRFGGLRDPVAFPQLPQLSGSRSAKPQRCLTDCAER